MNKYTIGNFFRKNIITLIVCIIPVFIVAIIYFAYHLPDGYKPYIFNMSGTWKIQEGKNDEWIKPGFNDSGWKEIQFPGSYYNQGFRDRYSVVRKKFILNENMKDKDLIFNGKNQPDNILAIQFEDETIGNDWLQDPRILIGTSEYIKPYYERSMF